MAKPDGELVREIKNATIRLSGSHAARFGLSGSCEQEAVRQLGELRARVADDMSRDGQLAAADFFYAEQNARLRAPVSVGFTTYSGTVTAASDWSRAVEPLERVGEPAREAPETFPSAL